MENTITIYWDAQDSNNPGFAWRNDDESGQIDDEDAEQYLRDLVNGEGGTVTGRDALEKEMLSIGYEIEGCHLSFDGFSSAPDMALG